MPASIMTPRELAWAVRILLDEEPEDRKLAISQLKAALRLALMYGQHSKDCTLPCNCGWSMIEKAKKERD